MTSGAAIDDDSSIPVASDAPVSLSPIRAIIAAKAKNAEIIIFTASLFLFTLFLFVYIFPF